MHDRLNAIFKAFFFFFFFHLNADTLQDKSYDFRDFRGLQFHGVNLSETSRGIKYIMSPLLSGKGLTTERGCCYF